MRRSPPARPSAPAIARPNGADQRLDALAAAVMMPSMVSVIGLDVGGANTKAAVVDGGRTACGSRPSRSRCGASRTRMAGVIASSSGGSGSTALPVALTTTAELVDVFGSKRDGVLHVLDAARQALPGRRLRVMTTDGELIGLEAARAAPLRCAAANWMATALLVARSLPDAILVDCGGTTTDVIPIVAGEVVGAGTHRRRAAARGRARLHRRAADQRRGGASRTCRSAAGPARCPPSCSRSAPTRICCGAA